MVTATSKADYGSFKDSLKAPIHRWFAYPAGYSHKLIENLFDRYNIGIGDLVVDPFLGTGTTSVVAKLRGIDSVGFEPHPYVCMVARTKLMSDLNPDDLWQRMFAILEHADASDVQSWQLLEHPALVHKCFTESALTELTAIRNSISALTEGDETSFFELALANTLRRVTTAGAGWPYIAPTRHAKRTVQRSPAGEFQRAVSNMVEDLRYLRSIDPPPSDHLVVNQGSADMASYVEPDTVDLMVTSPPYLNNYDYADRTRLETYFLGMYRSWSEITHNVRRRLMVSATTQIATGSMEYLTELPTVSAELPETYRYLVPRVSELTEIRKSKPGRKTYDILVAGYFEDMLPIIRASYYALKPGAKFVMVIGDSAPYGVHIETEHVIGMMAVEVGFSDFDVEIIRQRGMKWKSNSQRHSVPLKESILTITK